MPVPLLQVKIDESKEEYLFPKKMLGFTAQFVQPEDGAWGTDQGNLTWNGMVGMLQR